MATKAGKREFKQIRLKFAVKDATIQSSIWLVKFMEDGKLDLNEDALTLLKSISGFHSKPVAVLSICGPYRSGKSFFLSRMLGTNDAFKVSSEMDPCTKGIWMSTIVLECDDFVVVLLDTEGTDAAQESEQFSAIDMTKLLVFATLLSSYLIYNTTGALKMNDVDKMSCFSHIAETILLREGSSASDHLHEQNLQRFFPRFLWLLRDNTLEAKINGKPVSTTEYVKRKILVQSKQELCPRNEIVRTIVALFPSLECRQTPAPGNPVMKDSKFLTAIDETATFLLDSIHPKESFEHQIPIDGSMLANLIVQYVKSLNEPDTVPNIEFSWMEAVKKHLTERCQALVKEYCQEMQQKLQTMLPIEEGDLSKLQTQQRLPPKTLAGIHQTTFEPKLSILQKEAAHTLPSESHKRERDELINVQFKRKIVLVHDSGKIEGELLQFVEENLTKSQQTCEELFENLCSEQKDIQLKKLKADYFRKAVGPAKESVFLKETKKIPGAPLNVKIKHENLHKVKATWKHPEFNPAAAKEYEVEVLEDQSSSWEKKSTATREITLKVKPNTKYNLRIRGVNEIKHGEFCETVPFNTPPGKPEKPQKPTIKLDSSTKATFYVQRLPKEKENGTAVTHVIVESCVKSRILEWKDLHTETIKLSSLHTGDTAPYIFQVDLTKHEASESKEELFFYQVRLQNEAGISEPSDFVVISTEEMHPGKVQCSVHDCQPEARRIVLSWQHSKYYPKSAQHFLIRLRERLRGNFTKEVKYNECKAVIEDLQPATDFTFEICAANAKYTGEWHTIHIRTLPDVPNAPSKPTLAIVSHDKAKLTVKRQPKQEENGKPVHTVIVEQRRCSDLNQGKWTVIASTKKLKPVLSESDSETISFDLKLDSVTTDDTKLFYRVLMRNDIGVSKPSEEIQVFVNDFKLEPMSLDKTCCIVKPTSITLMWEKPFNSAAVKCYQVEKKIYQAGWKLLQEIQRHKDLSFTEIDLQPNTKHTYRVTAVGERNVVTSNELVLCTDSDRPNQPAIKLAMEIVSSTEALLRMPRPDKSVENGSPIHTIVVERSYDNGNKWEQEHINISSGEGNLQLNLSIPKKGVKSISFRVRFQNAKGISEPSLIHDVRPDDLIPGPPSNVTHDKSSHNITLSWKEPVVHPNAVDCYFIHYKKTTSTEWILCAPQKCTDLMCTLPNLVPNTEYQYRVSAFNKNKIHGEYYSAATETKKCRPKKPTNVGIKIIPHKNEAKITAQRPDIKESGSAISQIHSYLFDEDDQPFYNSKHDVTISDDSPMTINVSVEDKTHSIRISFINGIGESNQSDPLGIKTSQLTPGRISFLSVRISSFDRFTLSWRKPEIMARAVTDYEVLVEINGEWKKFYSQSATEIEISDSDLKPCTEYKVRVCAINGELKGRSSEIKANTVAASPTKPRIESMVMHDSNPTRAIIRFHRLTDEQERGSPVKSVKLQWSHDTGDWNPALKWDIHHGKNQIIEREFCLPDEVITTKQTKPTYCRIIMCSIPLESEPSDPFVIESSELRPGKVEDLKVVDKQAHSIKIGWGTPKINPNVIKYYGIHCYERKSSSDMTPIQNHEVNSDIETIEIKSLASNRTYMFEVCAKSEKCSGPQRDVDATTNEIIFGAPRNVRAEFRQRNAIKIRWNKPKLESSESPAYYKVFVDKDKDKEDEDTKFTRLTRGMSTVIKDLQPSSEYTVEVTSMNENGHFKEDGSSTASATIETTMSMAKRVFGTIGVAIPSLGIGAGMFIERTKQADDEDMQDTDSEYTDGDDSSD